MVVAAMVRRMVHGNAANAAINMFQNGTNCTKDLHISNKSRTFVHGLHKLSFYVNVRAPLAAIARGVLLSVWLKRLSILLKIHFFLKKKVEKICTYQKKFVPLHRLTNKTITTMKKRNIFRAALAVVSLALIALVCYWWHQQGCGVWSLIAAVSFYGVLSAGLMIAVEDVLERR